jgi:hypothetical protein
LDVKPEEEVTLPIVTRISQAPTTKRSELKAGDLVSVYYFKFRIAHRNSSGENPYFIDSEGATAGIVNVNVFAVDGDTKLVQTVNFTNLPSVVGKYGAIHSKVNGIDTSNATDYTSSDTAVARVDTTGFVVAVGTGSYTITAHIDGSEDVVSDEVVVTAPEVATLDTIPDLPTNGGVVSLTGTGLDAMKLITIDGVEVEEWNVKSATELDIVAPKHETGEVEVKLDGHWGNVVVNVTAEYV